MWMGGWNTSGRKGFWQSSVVKLGYAYRESDAV